MEKEEPVIQINLNRQANKGELAQNSSLALIGSLEDFRNIQKEIEKIADKFIKPEEQEPAI